jgi:hypothetical protein
MANVVFSIENRYIKRKELNALLEKLFADDFDVEVGSLD